MIDFVISGRSFTIKLIAVYSQRVMACLDGTEVKLPVAVRFNRLYNRRIIQGAGTLIFIQCQLGVFSRRLVPTTCPFNAVT